MKFNKLIPEISVTNIEESLRFYRDILGFKVEYSRPAEKFYFLSYEDIQFMVEEINNHWWTGELERPFGRGLNFQIEVSDVSVLMKSLEKAGINLFCAPKESWYKGEGVEFGQVEFLVQDPDGYLLRFIQDIGERKITTR
jgi:catechol 2,3-dioxygenase-like lactoylglutathione lyase family enzyme